MSRPDMPPPRAEARPFSQTVHGRTLDDPWHWLRDPLYPEVKDEAVLAYLHAENAYFEAAMKPHAALIDTMFEEMKRGHPPVLPQAAAGRTDPDEPISRARSTD